MMIYRHMYLKNKNCLSVRTFRTDKRKNNILFILLLIIYILYVYVFSFFSAFRYRSRSFATMYYLFYSFSFEWSADLTVGALICCKFQENQQAPLGLYIWLVCWVCSAMIIAHAVNSLLLILVHFNH